MISYISGGVRSGKSRFAQDYARQLSPTPVYVATARIWDDDFGQRVQRHRDERGPEWTTLEAERDLHQLPLTEPGRRHRLRDALAHQPVHGIRQRR